MIKPFSAQHLAAIRERLDPPAAPPDELLAALEMRVEIVTNEARAREILAELAAKAAADPDVVFGLDTETTPRDPDPRAGWLKLTKRRQVAAHQPDRDPTKAGLDPMRARVRLVQLFDPEPAARLRLRLRLRAYGRPAGPRGPACGRTQHGLRHGDAGGQRPASGRRGRHLNSRQACVRRRTGRPFAARARRSDARP